MAETNPHVSLIIQVREILRHWLRATKNAGVYANMFLYYRQGQPKARIAPDVFVAWGSPYDPLRRSFKLWEEPQPPQVVFEMTSRKTQAVDLGKKRFVYARCGVAEYYLFDPFREYLDPPLRGYQLAGEEYELRTLETLSPPAFENQNGGFAFSKSWRLWSESLQLEIWAFTPAQPQSTCALRFYDPAAGQWLTDPAQAMIEYDHFKQRAREAEARAANEALARRNAEERAARLEAELKKLRG
jgi:Uma2 family endonuclease